MLTQIIALFGAGVASFLAPCIIPLVPAYLGIIVGEMGDAHDPARAVPATLIFIAGFTTVFAGLGATAGALGSSLDTFQDGVRIVGGVADHRDGARAARHRARAARAGAAPDPDVAEGHGGRAALRGGHRVRRRVEPVRRPAARGRAHDRRPVGSGLARARSCSCAYALGIGVPFLLASLGLASSPGLAERLRRIGPNLERVSGVFLVVLGVLLVTNTYIHLTSYLARFVPAVHGL